MKIDYYNTLINLGYKLQDRGEYWQTSAVYRGGDNPTALQIYKDTGVWKDYVAGGGFKPFDFLIKNSNSSLISTKEEDHFSTKTFTDEFSTVTSEKIFSEEDFGELLPHFSFYEKKGIDLNILKNLNSGLSTGGAMYQRLVFPILNKHLKIHGLAGRDNSQSSKRPKWKHLGKKSKWIYPFYSFSDCRNMILETKQVYLVESIGDALSLMTRGFSNVLVTFGLDISPTLSCFLMGLNLDQIFICFNNDHTKDLNRGKIASIKNMLKLTSNINFKKLYICLPTKEDFGEMNNKDFELWVKKKKALLKKRDMFKINLLKESENLFSKGLISKNIFSNIKYIKND